MSYAIVLLRAGAGDCSIWWLLPISASRYHGRDADLPLSLGFKTEAPACGRPKKDLWWWQRKAVCSVEQRRGEEKRGEESLAAWIAWTALSGFMTPAV